MSKNLMSPRPSSFLYKLFSKIYLGLRKKACVAFGINTEYHYVDFSISLPPDHQLPFYQREFRLYDRFLPHLCKYLDPNSAVIDVGANCGDTLAAMYNANQTLTYVCIEPDEFFSGFLQSNISRIKSIDSTASIHTIKSLVGKNITDVSLEGSGGTKKAIVGKKSKLMASQSLDKLLSLINVTNIKLLKSDVDGFDYDVIDSSEATLKLYKPILFFECQFDHLSQKTGYLQTMERLRIDGYENWVVFDNFGEVVLQTTDMQTIYQLFEYVWRQNIKRTARTIFYYDLLGATKNDIALVDRVIQDYLVEN